MNNLIGKKIVEVRPATDAELQQFGWGRGFDGTEVVLVLDNGEIVIASQDAEGNGAGALFTIQGKDTYVLYD